jgi:hypothetical protein
MSLVQKQIENEEKYSRRNIQKWIKEVIMQEETLVYAMAMAHQDITEYMVQDYYPSKMIRYALFNEYNDLEPIMLEVMIEVLKAPNGTIIFQQIAGRVAQFVNGMEYIDALKTVSDIMGLMCHADLFDVIQPALADEGVLTIQSPLSLDEPMLQRIANTKYLPPMLVPPSDVKENKGNQYLTFKTSLIKKPYNFHNDYLAYDVINILQSYELSLDEFVVHQEIESPKNELDTQEKVDNFNRMVLASKATYLEILEAGNKFFEPWSYDKRGRSYMDGYHINYQSSQYKKALININPLKVSQCVIV